jgi:hypothetical protein
LGIGELLTEYKGIFAGDNKVYHRIDIKDARPIRQSLMRILLAKQAEVNEMHDDMQCCEVIKESDSPWSSPSFWSGRGMGNSISA